MKTRIFTGWQARFHGVCLMMLLSAMAAFAFASDANAQEADAPPVAEAVEAPVAEVADAPSPVAGTATEETPAEEEARLDSGDTAWMLTSTLLVLLMIVPGLALFYGGLVRSKNVLSVLSQVLVVASVVIVLWASTATAWCSPKATRSSARSPRSRS
jgi:Ammonia permease